MKSIEIKGNERTVVGKKDSSKLRAAEMVPCVIYGGENPIHFTALEKEFRKIVYTPNVHLVDLDIDGKKYKAIMQDLQFDPVTDFIQHIDFLLVNEKKPIKIKVPIKIIGFAKGIKAGGKLKLEMRQITIKALPQHLPDRIEINVENLDINQSIRIGDLKLDNVEFTNNKSVPVVRIMVTRAARAAMNAKK